MKKLMFIGILVIGIIISIQNISAQSCPGKPCKIYGPLSADTSSILTYSVDIIINTISYIWFVPLGTIIISGQGTPTIKVKFAKIDGNLYSNIGVFGENVYGFGDPQNLLVKIK